ncbi:MAG: YdcF family protein [Pseudomonadota bacterium]|nr:YdcF family protein [Pseudomonadota bacterium]
MSPKPSAPPSRWRYLRDGDVLHALGITVLAVVLSGGLVWLVYLIWVVRIAARSSLDTPARMTVLVFGCLLANDEPSLEYQRRLNRALTLAQSGQTDRILVLGGCSGGRRSEAAAGQDWLQQHGLPDGVSVEMEQDSIDSLENLRHARRLLQESGDTDLPRVALVTSRYHLARCLMLAQRLGFDGVPVPAEPTLPWHPRYLARVLVESGYVMCMELGLRWARLLGLRRMASRVR